VFISNGGVLRLPRPRRRAAGRPGGGRPNGRRSSPRRPRPSCTRQAA